MLVKPCPLPSPKHAPITRGHRMVGRIQRVPETRALPPEHEYGKGNQLKEKQSPIQKNGTEDSFPGKQWAGDTWKSFSGQQRVYTVIAGGVLLIVLFRAAILLAILFERVAVRLAMTMEEAVIALVFKSAALAAVIGFFGLILFGLYIFMSPSQDSQGRR